MTSQYDGIVPAPNRAIGNTPTNGEARRRIGGSTYAPEIDLADTDAELAGRQALNSGSWSGTKLAAARRRRRRRRWYRRPLVVLPLFLVIAFSVVAGYAVRRAESTVSTVQSVSTPPPVVSLRTDDPPLNEDGKVVAKAAVQVDTNPALQALKDAGIDTSKG